MSHWGAGGSGSGGPSAQRGNVPLNGNILRFTLTHQFDQTGTVRPIVRRHRENIDDQGQIIAPNSIRPQEFAQGFNEIHLLFLDRQVLQFWQNFLNSTQIDISITPRGGELQWTPSQRQAISQFFSAFRRKIFRLDFFKEDDEDPRLNYWDYCDKYFAANFPEIMAEAQELALEIVGDEEEMNFALNWLMKRRQDGKHKILPLGITNEALGHFIESVKEEFINSRTSNPFLIDVMVVEDEDHMGKAFRLQNEHTGEVLATAKKDYQLTPDFHTQKYFIVRHPIDAEDSFENWAQDMTTRKSTTIFLRIERFGIILHPNLDQILAADPIAKFETPQGLSTLGRLFSNKCDGKNIFSKDFSFFLRH